MTIVRLQNPFDSAMNIERWGWYSIAVNLFLALLHGIVAAASGSLAMVAEWIHNITDLLTAAAVLIGLKLAARKSSFFPYGLYKVENLVAAGLAAMIFLSAYEIGREALPGAFTLVQVRAWMLATLLVTTFIPLVFDHFELRAGQVASTLALIAPDREYRMHVFTTCFQTGSASRSTEWLVAQKVDVVLVSADVQGKGPAMLCKTPALRYAGPISKLSARQ